MPASIIIIFVSDSIWYVFISVIVCSHCCCCGSCSNNNEDNCDDGDGGSSSSTSMSILSIRKSLILTFKNLCDFSISVCVIGCYLNFNLSVFHHIFWFKSLTHFIFTEFPYSKCSLKSHSNWMRWSAAVADLPSLLFSLALYYQFLLPLFYGLSNEKAHNL